MKICIYGAGAIGGYIGVMLKRAGADVSLVARGSHLEAINQNGLKLQIKGEEYPRRYRPPAIPRISARRTTSSSRWRTRPGKSRAK
jgi:2-dehydropantoate 2-reductase